MNLNNRTILITGGTSGIGLELAKALVARHCTVIVTGRDRAKLDHAVQSVPDLHTIQSDVSDLASIDALYREVTDRFPALDILVNNAGIMRNIDLRAEPAESVAAEIDILLSGPIRMVQRFLPHLLSRPGAAIVNVSSGLAFVPFAAAPIYSGAKAGLHAYTQCLRAQLADHDIAIVELAPPGTETALFRGEFQKEMKGQRGMPVEQLVRHALSGLERGKAEIRPGLANVLKVASRIAPGVMFRQMAKLSGH